MGYRGIVAYLSLVSSRKQMRQVSSYVKMAYVGVPGLKHGAPHTRGMKVRMRDLIHFLVSQPHAMVLMDVRETYTVNPNDATSHLST